MYTYILIFQSTGACQGLVNEKIYRPTVWNSGLVYFDPDFLRIGSSRKLETTYMA